MIKKKIVGFILGFAVIVSACGCSNKETKVDNITAIESEETFETTVTENVTTENQGVQATNIKKGDYITFGSYEQDNDISNGKEEIEWLVLDVEDEKALIISKHGLDCEEFNEAEEIITWQDCSLRTWLNSVFIDTAFKKNEKDMILTATVSADENPEYDDINPGSITKDKVFLLSIKEAKKYFDSDKSRKCLATAYAEECGIYTDDGYCSWWLRTPGAFETYAAGVENDGSVRALGRPVNSYVNTKYAVRPALWVDLDYFTTENQELTIADAEVGDYITFGSYEPAGGEEIEWLVLEKNDKKALVISKYALYRMKYNSGDEDTTWEDCTLRKWLNSEFIDVTFSEDEKAKLLTVTVPASRNPEYDTNPGNSTEDKVYLLSIDEVNRYFDSDEEKRCLATAYAMESDSETQKATEGYCSGWYLRTPGDSPIFVACVNVKGNINVGGACTYYINGYYIRPALWISLE